MQPAISKSLAAIKHRRNQANRVRTLLGLLPDDKKPNDIDGLVNAAFELTNDDDDDDAAAACDDEAEGDESGADEASDNDTGHD